MMDTIMHSTHGYLIGKGIELLVSSQWPDGGNLVTATSVCGVLAGGLPDILGFIGNKFLKDNWALYNEAHSGKLSRFLRWLPPYGLHIWLDTFSHGDGKRWWVWKERLWLEIICWLLTIAALAYCWPDLVGWAESVAVYMGVSGVAEWLA